MDECQNVIDFEELEKLCSDDATAFNMGQSESKKAAKKAGLETRGTAMSFGFKKKNSSKNSASATNNNTINNNNNTNNNNNNNNSLGRDKDKTGSGTGKKDKYKSATVISNFGVVHADDDDDDNFISDKNGNTGSLESLEESEVATNGRCTTPRLQPPKKEISGAPYRNNRFGFRQTNVVRPASVGLQPKITDIDNIINNNTNNNISKLNSNLNTKRRSKSASATSRLTTLLSSHQQQQQQPQTQHYESQLQHQKHPNQKITAFNQDSIRCNNQYMNSAQHQQHLKQYSNLNHHQQQQQQQYATVVDSELHTNKIVKPIPQPVSISKFTLHTASLPRPQYPVPISLTADGHGTATSSLSSTSRCSVMDKKVAKHAVNTSRKESILREESCDSGISSYDSFNYAVSDMSRMPRQRYRNLEMVMSGRNKFELRDLETLSDDSITSLILPKLPIDTNSASIVPLSGLVRTSTIDRLSSSTTATATATAASNRGEGGGGGGTVGAITTMRQNGNHIDEVDSNLLSNNNNNNSICPLARKESITSSEMESFEEEKLITDNNSSEKSHHNGAIMKDMSEKSKASSPGSSRSSWCNAGETMAFKDYSSISLSSNDEFSSTQKQIKKRDEEDVSSVTLTAGHQSLLLSTSASSKTQSRSCENAPRSLIMHQSNSNNNNNKNNRDNFVMNFEESKFAEIAAAVSDALLDDETSPTDSLVSSYSDDMMAGTKKSKKKIETRERDAKEKDIDEISPELDTMSPLSPGTPTHASNSLSLSDGGRDFLIDDEIADQPALIFDNETENNMGHDSSIIDNHNSSLIFNGNSSTDTPTLRDASSLRSASKKTPINKPRKVMPSQYESPAMPRKSRTGITRAESLDTLSPCESIGSDDFMLDFDSNSSLDSVDRIHKSNGSGSGSGILSMDETQLRSELENKGGDIMREWSSLLGSQKRQLSRENISLTSQLPARATRLLTRRLQSNAGSDSPRSLDSVSARTPVLKTSFNQCNRNESNTNSADDLSLVDKSFRNAMLQDVAHCKKQLFCLRRILQETETLNPFENNGQLFDICGMDGVGGSEGGGGTDDKSQQPDPKAVAVLAMLENHRQELTDLRRQVVYLQTQIDDKDRLIRIQQNLINKLEADKEKPTDAEPQTNNVVETMNTATQTDRLRPLSIGGQDGITSQIEKPTIKNGLKTNIPEVATKIIKQPLNTNTNCNIIHNSNNNINTNNKKSSTQISSIYTQLSSVKQIPVANNPVNKTVKTTKIGNVIDGTTLQKAKISANLKLQQTTVATNNNDSKLRTSIKTQMNGNHNHNSQNSISLVTTSSPSKLYSPKKSQLKSVSSTSSLSSSGTGITSRNSSTTSLNNNNNNFMENNNNLYI